ncbi:hypothetical protein Lal_00018458 [Lupinus albus]|nr:hypothetical protein Lal_00018458 [Lupinus albus]
MVMGCSLKSKKQTILTQSTMKYEIITPTFASEEEKITLWKTYTIVLIHCASTMTILLSTGTIIVDRVRIDVNEGDHLTKRLDGEKIQNTSKRMGLLPLRDMTYS